MTAASVLNLVGATVPAFDDPPVCTVPHAGDAPAGAPVPAGAVLSRDYFHSGHDGNLPRFESLVGPLSPTPNRPLAEIVAAIVAADRSVA